MKNITIGLSIASLLVLTALTEASAQMRMGMGQNGASHWFVGISPMSYHGPSLVSYPVSLGYGFSNSFQAGIEYGGSSFDWHDETDEDHHHGPGQMTEERWEIVRNHLGIGDEFEAKGTYVNQGIYIRKFWGRSFNTKLAFHRRELKTSDLSGVLSQGTATERRFFSNLSTTTDTVGFGLGHQWTFFPGVVFGIDWAVVSKAMNKTSSSEINDAGLNADEKAAAKQKIEDLGDRIHRLNEETGYLVLTVGVSF